LFPDGRLWLSRLLWRVENDGSTEEPVGLTGNHFVSGSNWVDAATSYRAIIGIQSNGSLWYAETEGKFIVVGWNKPLVQSQKPIEMTRFGNETNWQSVSREGNFPLLLKKDGTLWLWGTNHFDSWQNSWRDKWPGLHTFQPYRFATESNWTEMFSTYDDIYLRTSDGHVWTLLRGAPYKQTNSHEIASGVWVMRNSWETNLDRIKWRSLAKGYSDFGLGVREDGTLWIYGNLRRKRISPSNSELLGFEMRQIGKETNWMSVTWDSVTPVALKFDGSLWKLKKSDWLQKTHPNEVIINTITTLVRAGNHSDWIAVQHLWNGILALAADGSLWYWQTGPLYLENYHHLPRFMLAAPRKPALIGNIFDKSG
jgi:alpha-tubulin suppressor-like RCC1 family protein